MTDKSKKRAQALKKTTGQSYQAIRERRRARGAIPGSFGLVCDVCGESLANNIGLAIVVWLADPAGAETIRRFYACHKLACDRRVVALGNKLGLEDSWGEFGDLIRGEWRREREWLLAGHSWEPEPRARAVRLFERIDAALSAGWRPPALRDLDADEPELELPAPVPPSAEPGPFERLVEELIALAERRHADSASKSFPAEGVPPVDVVLGPPPPALAALRSALGALPYEILRKVEVLMYAGRASDSVYRTERELLRDSPAITASTICSKLPLHMYLRRGLDRAKTEGVDVEAPNFAARVLSRG